MLLANMITPLLMLKDFWFYEVIYSLFLMIKIQQVLVSTLQVYSFVSFENLSANSVTGLYWLLLINNEVQTMMTALFSTLIYIILSNYAFKFWRAHATMLKQDWFNEGASSAMQATSYLSFILEKFTEQLPHSVIRWGIPEIIFIVNFSIKIYW